MKFGVYAIEDIKIESFSAPFTSPNNNTAMRQFGDVATDPNTNINRHPDDYRLCRLGEWDDQSGEFTSEKPTTLAWAKDYHGGPEKKTNAATAQLSATGIN